MHVLKIITLTGFLTLLVSYVSMALPITQPQIPLQKTEQVKQKKPSLAERIFHKRLKKQLKKAEKPNSSARLALAMGALSFPLLVLGFFLLGNIALLGLGFALGAVITGTLEVKKHPRGTKNNKFLRIGLILGAITLGIYAIFVGAYLIAWSLV